MRVALSLLYGHTRISGAERSEYFRKSEQSHLRVPKIDCYVGNRLTQANFSSAKAFRAVVTEIGKEIFSVWRASPGNFHIHPAGSPLPSTTKAFRDMFQFEVVDANSASVVSGALGIPIVSLSAGTCTVAGRTIRVNQTQLDRQKPNIQDLVSMIE